MLIIPSIDIYEGACVRLTQGDFSRRVVYDCDPEMQAQEFVEAGATYLHIVDLEGAKKGSIVNWSTLEKILSIEGLEVQIGGGVRSDSDVQRLLQMGVHRVVVGSIAVQRPELLEEWSMKFGAEKFCVAIDVRDGHVSSEGWQKREESQLSEIVIRMSRCGIQYFLSTDIEYDGTLRGPNIELYSNLVKTFPTCSWLASGGVSSKEDLLNLGESGVTGVIVGKAFYENKLSLKEIMARAW